MEAGTPLALDGSQKCLRPCRACGSVVGFATGPAGPHFSGVRCAECRAHLGWMKKPADQDDEFDLIETP
jgi:hypothetical protein